MTIPTITCEQFADGLPDLLERTVDERTRARLESHAVSCADCGPLLADVRKLSTDAAALPELVPSRDLWTGIAARIETPVVELTKGGKVEGWKGGKERRRRVVPFWLGLAAAGLVGLTATITHQVTKRTVVVAGGPAASPSSQIAPTAPISAPSQTVATAPAPTSPTTAKDSIPPFHLSTIPPLRPVTNKSLAEQAYDAEIAGLRAVVDRRRTLLDTATVGVIERNLKVIDDAIAQCRDALQKDPASQFLMESLNDALDTKIKLLRTAATLPART